jgi:hypothetical protein
VRNEWCLFEEDRRDFTNATIRRRQYCIHNDIGMLALQRPSPPYRNNPAVTYQAVGRTADAIVLFDGEDAPADA